MSSTSGVTSLRNVIMRSSRRPFGYTRVYLLLCKVADNLFMSKGITWSLWHESVNIALGRLLHNHDIIATEGSRSQVVMAIEMIDHTCVIHNQICLFTAMHLF